MAKPTGEPVHDDHIRFYIVVHGLCDIEERVCSIDNIAISIQCFTFKFLLVCTNDLFGVGKFGAESIGISLRVGKLDVKPLDGCLEIFYLFTLMTESRLG